jgi:hypothetical protein
MKDDYAFSVENRFKGMVSQIDQKNAAENLSGSNPRHRLTAGKIMNTGETNDAGVTQGWKLCI